MKIFNFGLPKTGTTSFHYFLLRNGVKSLHANRGQINFLYPTEYNRYIEGIYSELDKYIEKFEAFSDLPWFSLADTVIERQKEDSVFFATYRKPHLWVKSFFYMKIDNWYGNGKLLRTALRQKKMGKTIENQNVVDYFDKILQIKGLHITPSQLISFYDNHYKKLQRLADKHGCKITILDYSKNTKNIVEQLEEVITIKDRKYPHMNKTNTM